MSDTTRVRRRPGDAGARVLLVWSRGAKRLALPASGDVVLGRGADADLRIDDESLSRRHARLVVGELVTIEDLGSRNGTRVAGIALRAGEARELALGSVAELGDVVVALQRSDLAAPPEPTPNGVIAVDPRTRATYELLDVVAPSDVSVLILGETGTGKEVLAHALHQRSSRRDRAWLALSCAALPDSMLEAELFGYERGAFTGAVQAKPGLFESADGGTVFLDEVGELPVQTQAKLLRVLESGETMRLGSVRPKRVDVRIVSATNRDLTAAIASTAFRADLFYRLAGFTLKLSPLRDRPADIEPLARHFLDAAARRAGTPLPALAPAARAALAAHGWPGNAREVKHVVERALLLARGSGTIDAAMLGLEPATRVTPPAGGLRDDIEVLERERIVAALEACGGNQSQAAKQLGIARGTLLAKLDQHGLERPRKRR